MFFSGLHGNDLCPSMSLTSQLGSYAISWLIPTRSPLSSATPKPSDHHISCLQQFHQGAVPQWMDPKPVRCAKIVAQHLVRRSNFPWRSSVERRRTGATDGSHGHGGKKHGGNWTPIDTHTHMYIYVYLRMLTHICSYNMHMLVLSIFVCECMCFHLIIPKWGQGL